jgi:hypothetical protein
LLPRDGKTPTVLGGLWDLRRGASTERGTLWPACPTNGTRLIAALHQLTAFTEGLLTLNERLVTAYDTNAHPSAEELGLFSG